jgi:hypothetical protein
MLALGGCLNVSIRDRLLSPCAVQNVQTEAVTVDVGALLTRLLLFDTFVVKSFYLKELPTIVELFGYRGTIELLKTSAIRFHPYRLLASNLQRADPEDEASQTDVILAFSAQVPPPRPGHFEITNVKIDSPDNAFHEYLQQVHSIPSLSRRQQIDLKSKIAAALVRIPDDYGEPSTNQTHADLDVDRSGLHRTVAKILTDRSGQPVSPNDVSLHVSRESEVGVFVESNLESDFGMGPYEAHEVMGNALLSIDRQNVRIEQMKLCSAIAGTPPGELPHFEEKLQFVLAEVTPEAHGEQF